MDPKARLLEISDSIRALAEDMDNPAPKSTPKWAKRLRDDDRDVTLGQWYKILTFNGSSGTLGGTRGNPDYNWWLSNPNYWELSHSDTKPEDEPLPCAVCGNPATKHAVDYVGCENKKCWACSKLGYFTVRMWNKLQRALSAAGADKWADNS